MRIGLIVLGVALLVLGGVFYFIPTQSASATTSSAGGPSTVSTASVNIPWGATVAILIAGFLFTLLGFTVSGGNDARSSRSQRSYDATSEKTTSDDGRTKHTTHEKHVSTTEK